MKRFLTAESSLPAVQQAVRNRRVGTDSRADLPSGCRMLRVRLLFSTLGKSTYVTLQRSLTRCRREAKFRTLEPQLASSPSCCSSERSNENSYNSTRPSRKTVAANQVFHPEEDSIADQSGLSLVTSTLNDSQMALSDVTPALQPDVPLVLPFRLTVRDQPAVLRCLGTRRRNLVA